MAGQSAMCTRSEVISKLKMLERGPMKPMGGGNPNHGSSSMSPKIPTGQAGK